MTNLINTQEPVLTTEAIHTQDDKVFVTKALNIIAELRNYIVSNNVTGNFKPTNDSKYLKIITNLNKIFSSRFGVKFNFITSSNSLLSTNTIYPPEYNVLMGDVSAYYKHLEDIFKNAKVVTGDVTDKEKEKEKVYNKIYNSFKSLKSKLDTSSIYVDLENSRIVNAPSNMFVFINFMPGALFSDRFDLDNREILAGFIHEVGHNITSISNSFRHIQNTTVILDSMHETINNRNGSPIDGIRLSYNRLTGKELKSNNILNATIAVRNVYSNTGFNGDGNLVTTTTDGEVIADQFASRFLLGDSLVSGLVKLGGSDRPNTSVELSINYMNQNILPLLIFALLVGPFAVSILPWFLTLLALSVKQIRQHNKTDRVYPDFNKRMLRVKQDAIRQIRLLKDDKCNKPTVDRLVSIVESVDISINMFKNNKDAISKFIDNVQYTKDDENLLAFNETILNLMENDLHYISAKI